jgi:hypothetical protein
LFNFKISGIAAGIAFVLSLLVGIISGSGFFTAIFRALIFAVLFFVLFCLIFWVVGQFMPELLSAGEDDLDLVPGSRVNLTASGPIVGAFPTGSVEDVDDIEGKAARNAPLSQRSGEDLGSFGPASAGMDQGDQSGYTRGGGGLGSGTSSMDASGGDGGLMPDFDVLSGSSSNSSGAEAEADSTVYETPSEPRRPLSTRTGKNDIMGDFDPKELAQAIRTVLKKEDKG